MVHQQASEHAMQVCPPAYICAEVDKAPKQRQPTGLMIASKAHQALQAALAI
jgi:hypothetical protein